MEMDFEDFWVKLQRSLSPRQEIINWTADKGKTGENFTAESDVGNYIIISPQSAQNDQRVPKADFKLIFDNWQMYLNRKVRRSDLMQQSRFTKYTISILHQYQNLMA